MAGFGGQSLRHHKTSLATHNLFHSELCTAHISTYAQLAHIQRVFSNCATTVQSTNLPELGRSRIRSTSYRGAHSVHINTLAASRNWRDQPPTFPVTAITLYQWWTGPQTRAGTRLRREGQASRDGERMTFSFPDLLFAGESPALSCITDRPSTHSTVLLKSVTPLSPGRNRSHFDLGPRHRDSRASQRWLRLSPTGEGSA
jgi:hypothetical protein